MLGVRATVKPKGGLGPPSSLTRATSFCLPNYEAAGAQLRTLRAVGVDVSIVVVVVYVTVAADTAMRLKRTTATLVKVPH